ncbi:aminopeptidase P family protein [Alkalinema pantanalense CENA528]|uniref:aminopeptidase P family protein n=1 Tax=Alkalinema pantanalense TaxID=1620705 RepID=UPI003D6F7FAD
MPIAQILQQRRQKLATLVDFPVLLWSGDRPSRNFPANQYPFRASSHFLYFAGLPLPNAVIHLQNGRLTLFMDEAPAGAALWHGESPTREQIAAEIGADAAYPLAELWPRELPTAQTVLQPSKWTIDAATIGLCNEQRSDQCYVLDRSVNAPNYPEDRDLALAEAIVQLRLGHDAAAIADMRQAAAVTVQAHKAGMAATRSAQKLAQTEAAVRAAMEQVILAHNMTTAYNSIVTVHGEVLHNEHYHHVLQPQDLLLADVGAETANGWAADVTRTWPTSGKFSPTQRAVYEVVLAAHDAAIAAVKPGMEYREIHLLACATLAAGLVDLGILRGDPEDLVATDAHALFFPHGVGHLLGLDVHDMEDLGDLAGYAAGRQRSDRFGLGYLRLDRPLQAGMVVTIEPGFYQVPALLNDASRRDQYADRVNWERLAEFADVRGIRIENDVLVTDNGSEVITAALPTTITEIETLMEV